MSGIDANVIFLARPNGADASTTFVDVGPSALTLTAGGSAQCDTAIVKFSKSIMLETSGDSVTMTTPALGTADFTFDTWVYFSSVSGFEGIFGPTSGVSTAFCLRRGGTGLDCYSGDTSNVFSTSGVTLATGTWYHVAAERIGSTCKVYINGVVRGSAASGWGTNLTHTAYGLGKDRNGFNAANMQLEEPRLSSIARYGGSNFTPPSAAYTPDGVSLTADVGSFALTGIAALFKASQISAVGSFTETGVAANLNTKTASAVGSYTLTGNDVVFVVGSFVTAAAGSFALTGNAATFGVKLVSAAGSYALTGNDATFKPKMAAGIGAYVLSMGSAVSLVDFVSSLGQLAITGSASGGKFGLPSLTGEFVLTGFDAQFSTTMELWTNQISGSESWAAQPGSTEVWTPQTSGAETWH